MKEKKLRRILPKTFWGDRQFGIHRFHQRLGRLPEKRPVRFNDHLFALKTSGKLNDPMIQFLTDKEYAKLYTSETVGKKFVNETYQVLRSKEELDNFRLDRFPCILKPTHSSGQAMPCVDPSTLLNREELRNWFDIDYYERSREHNHRYLVPKIIVEELFSEDGQTTPKDYKTFCFQGVLQMIQVDTDRFSDQVQSFYDVNWTRIPVVALYPGRDKDEEKPILLERILDLARQLSSPFPFVRVDTFAARTEIRIGKLTFMPWSGAQPLQPVEVDFAWGAYFRENDCVTHRILVLRGN